MGRATPPRETGGAARIAMLGTVAAAAITGLATVSAVLVPRLFDGDEQRSPGAPVATVVSRIPEPPAPLTIAVRQSETHCGWGWLFPKNPSQLEKPPVVENIDWIAWAQRGGGVRVNQHQVTLTLQGITEAWVVIDRIRVVTLEPAGRPCGAPGPQSCAVGENGTLTSDPPTDWPG